MKKKILFLGISILLGFGLFSRIVKTGVFDSMDFAVTIKLQERIDTSSHLRLADVIANIMNGSTFFASPEVSLLLLGVLSAVFCIDFRKKTVHLRGFVVPFLFGLLVLFEIYGKTVIHHPAPAFFLIKNPTSLFPADYVNDQFSYPSGHVARSVFLSLSFYSFFLSHTVLFRTKKFRLIGLVLVFLFIGLVSVSRIYLGHHWLSDVVGGALLGSALWTFVQVFAVY
jgi:membrane-associated phospholipid phosphatase